MSYEDYPNTLEGQLARAKAAKERHKAWVASLPPEERALYRKNKRKDIIYGGIALSGIVGGNLLYSSIKNHGNPFGEQPNTPIEQHGDHHGSTGTPSGEHLKQFAREHGIQLHERHGIGTAVRATEVGDHLRRRHGIGTAVRATEVGNDLEVSKP